MNKDRQEQIAARAYQLWEDEGRPHGAHERHWEQATRDVDAAGQATPKARNASAPRKGPAKAAKSAIAAKTASNPKARTAAPVRAAAAKVEDVGDKLSRPATGNPSKR